MKKESGVKMPKWFKMVSLFDGDAREIAKLNGEDAVVLAGVKYRGEVACPKCGASVSVSGASTIVDPETGGEKLDLSPELAVCVVPRTLSSLHANELRKMLEGNLRMPVVLLSDNIHLVRLREIPNHVATSIMEGSDAEKN